MKTVMSFGTFDHFHAGHESYLKQAKALGDILIVIIARDVTVKRLKGKLPDHNEVERFYTVKQNSIADKVVLGERGDKYAVIRKYKPDVIALGYDQFTFTFRLEKFFIDHKMSTKIVRLNPYRPEVYKTSIIRYEHLQKSL